MNRLSYAKETKIFNGVCYSCDNSIIGFFNKENEILKC